MHPGVVWQKQAHPFSQIELKVGKLGFSIHFECVSAALDIVSAAWHFTLLARHCTSGGKTAAIFPFESLIGEFGPLGITYQTSHTLRALSHTKYPYSAFNFSFHKFSLILKDWFLIRLPPNFQERFLMSSASPEFVFWGPKIKQFCFKQV